MAVVERKQRAQLTPLARQYASASLDILATLALTSTNVQPTTVDVRQLRHAPTRQARSHVLATVGTLAVAHHASTSTSAKATTVDVRQLRHAPTPQARSHVHAILATLALGFLAQM
jgi:hypothetical protein